jgi:hypothetical protein
MQGALQEYLCDPLLNQMYSEVRRAGALRAVSVDITHVCNLRCKGCYFFSEGLDNHPSPTAEHEFDALVEREKGRGTNVVTVVGGEPALVLHRVKKLYDNFHLFFVTNGLIPIPQEGFANMNIAVSVWGDRQTDMDLRGRGKVDVFSKALRHFRDDPRAFWYFTVSAGNAHQIESVVDTCVDNGNRVFFSFYGDLDHFGGSLDHQRGFAGVRREIHRMIEKYPDRILTTSYLAEVVSTGQLYDEKWGYDVCPSLSASNPRNAARLANGKPCSPHFEAYNADFRTRRLCCVSDQPDCSSCFNVWPHMSWIMINLEKHLGSAREFANWLTTVYVFYLLVRAVDFERGVKLLPAIHELQRGLRDPYLRAT